MNRFAFIAALVTGFTFADSAFAQWQFSGGAAMRQVRMVETDQAGHELVREHGWLPGIELRADYTLQDWRVGVSGEVDRGKIAYDGQVQSGATFMTDTDTTQSRVGLEVARRVAEATHLIGGIEWDRWRRDIRGRGKVMGLHERYTSWRLLAGAETRVLQTSWASLHARALLVHAAPEKLRVRFENRLFDEANLTTRSATGVRLGLNVQPAATPHMTVGAEFDWLRIPRSSDAVLRRDGATAGIVTQAEHSRRAFSLHLAYHF